MQPLVTAIIPTYNSSGSVLRALASAVAQDFVGLEIIIVDDASIDDTVSKVKNSEFADQCRIIELTQNAGASVARNRGIDAAVGEFVAFLDSDDSWEPTKISHQVKRMRQDSNISILGCQGKYISPQGEDLGFILDSPPGISEQFWKCLLRYSYIHTSTVLTSKDRLRRIGGFDENMVVGEDQDLWIRLALDGNAGVLNECLVTIYDTPNSLMSQNIGREAEFLLPMIRKFLLMTKGRIAPSERREILGYRMSKIGRNLYSAGETFRGVRLLIGGSLYGYEPFTNFMYLISASRPCRWLKKILGV